MKPETFTSRSALVMAALGMAIGTGNIWRFPRIAAQNGGGAFLIAWMAALLFWSLPILMVEFGIGKKTRLGPIGALGRVLGPRFYWAGGFVTLCTAGIMCYYSVVTGWCIHYFLASSLSLVGTDPEAHWNAFSGGYQPVFFHLIAIGLAALIVSRGVVRGIERINRVFVPLLFILLALSCIRSLTLPGSAAGLEFLFHPRWEQLASPRIWLEAFSQSAWSVGAGWGLMLTYAIYSRRDEDIVLNSCLTGFGNNSASILAGLAVLPTVFSFLPASEVGRVLESGNTGMAFIWLPRLFQKIPQGELFMTLFFLALSIAALSSLIAMVELAVRALIDFGATRTRAVRIVFSAAFLLGLPSALSLGILDNQDWVWGVGLLISGFLIIVAAVRFGISRFREEVLNGPGSDLRLGRWFHLLVFLIPLEFAVLLGWWLHRSVTGFDPAGWWNPFHTFSAGTCLFQWTILCIVLVLLNNRLGGWLSVRTGNAGEAGP